MTKLEMEDIIRRVPLRKYFYGDAKYLSFLFWISIPLIFFFGIGILTLLIWAVLKIVHMFKRSSECERLYDEFIAKDMDFLKKRAIEHMGLVSEEYSLIDPIITNWFGTAKDVITGQAIAEKKDFIDMIKAIPIAILNYIRSLFGLEDIISQSIFFEGGDKKIRCTLRSVTFIAFTEQQIVAYVCNYDIALGIILSESVREVFYRDVDSVNYGKENWHITVSNGSIKRVIALQIRLSIPSKHNIVATVPADWDIMANVTNTEDILGEQVTAMKSLIRSKKEEMS